MRRKPDIKKPALLQVENLYTKISSAGKSIQAVDGISFSLQAGQSFALVGESGSGKSMAALSLTRLVPRHIFPEISGKVFFNGEDMLSMPESKLRKLRGRKIAYIFQDPMSSLNPLQTVYSQIRENITLHTKLRQQSAIQEKAITLLSQVGLQEAPSYLNRYPHELSGGQRQRIMIAMALSADARLLIADEPTTSLDVTVQAQILKLLSKLKQELQLSMLFITHDLSLVEHVADEVAVMRNGRIVEQASMLRLFKKPTHSYTQDLFASRPQKLLRLASEEAAFTRNLKKTTPILQVKNFSVKYPIKSKLLRRTLGQFTAVESLSFSLHAGRTLGIIGESGSGKTSLALGILRLVPTLGEILLKGQPIHAAKSKALLLARKNMQVVFQDPFSSLSPRMTAGDTISEGLSLHRKDLSSKERRELGAKAIAEVGLPKLTVQRYPHEFSGGERQRIALARAIILKPKLIILDEPTSSLDVSLQKRMIDLLLRLQEKYSLSYLFISHDLRVVRALADDILVMRHAKTISYGKAKNIFRSAKEPYTRALIEAAMLGDKASPATL